MNTVEPASVETLTKRLDRAQRKIAILESMIEDRTRSLFIKSAELERSKAFLERILDTMSSALIVVDGAGCVQRVNRATTALTGYCIAEDAMPQLRDLLDVAPDATVEDLVAMNGDAHMRCKGGTSIPVLLSVAKLHTTEDEADGAVCIAVDMREKQRLEMELRQAQKLESIGQLAAGIAHEVNTPIQFTGDSIYFLKDAFADLCRLIDGYEGLRACLPSLEDVSTHCEDLAAMREQIDVDFVVDEIPAAIARALDGVDRVATIVSAMKAFAHPGGSEKAHQDINAAIQTTLEVCRNEYKYVATVDLKLGDLPLVYCKLGDINQVLLNLIVNAAHAIEGVVASSGATGRITITTIVDGEDLVVTVSDTGGGIPDEIRERVFDPFFTTKEVGAGTGQGLAIARRIIVDGHGGTLRFESVAGEGTTFELRIPVGRTEAGA